MELYSLSLPPHFCAFLSRRNLAGSFLLQSRKTCGISRALRGPGCEPQGDFAGGCSYETAGEGPAPPSLLPLVCTSVTWRLFGCEQSMPVARGGEEVGVSPPPPNASSSFPLFSISRNLGPALSRTLAQLYCTPGPLP